MDKITAIRKFVRNNYRLLDEKMQFDRSKYKDIKKDYFGRVLKYQFGSPNDKEICDVFVEILIKNEKILDKAMLQQAIDRTPFLKMNLPPASWGVSVARILVPSSLEFALQHLKTLLATPPRDSSPQQAAGYSR